MSTDFELFPGKNLSGLFKDIYDNQQNKKQRISELIAEMKKVIRHAGDMAVIGQRIIGAQHKAEGDSGFLSDEEKEQLLKQLDETIAEVADEQDLKVDELTNEIEELKQKVGK